MTTIAYCNGVVASDSALSVGEWIGTHTTKKIHRLSDTSVVAIVGGLYHAIALLEWIKGYEMGERPNVEDNAQCIKFVKENGVIRIFMYGQSSHHEIEAPRVMAWGSGTPVALGALLAGASALDAVKIAAQVDPYTKGPFHHEVI
jgi:ATP-dependent protease HslVU (ClpYQ) peptidase subunit